MGGVLTAAIAAAFAGGVTADPYYEYTTLLLPGNGTNGAQNNTFLDGSTNNFTITRNGNTTQGTFSPFSQTGWGNYFPGTDPEAAIETSVSSKFAFGGNWTAELWYYPVERTGAYPVVFSIIDSSGATGFAFFDRHAGASSVFRFEGFSTSHNLNTVVQNNTWYHIALSYNGSVLSFYINGVLDSTLTVSIGSSNRALRIGRNYDSASYNESIKAYISNFRVISGQNLYTGTFTPSTTPLTATTVGSTGAGAASTITGTVQFLGCQSNCFVDNSPTPSSLTISNNPSVVAFSPFNPSASWSAATYGGSGYFDGSGDYLSLSNNVAFQFGTGDFTIEFWHYSNSSGTQVLLYDSRPATTNGLYPTIYKSSGNVLVFYTNSADRITGTTSLLASTWYHVALSRSGTATKLFLNGIQEGSTYTDSNNYTNGTSRPLIGGDGYNASSVLNGYLSGVRIVKGTAVYTGNFTPPSLLPITNDGSTSAAAYPSTTNVNTSFASSATSLLLNFTNAGIYDATSKNDLETVGNASISNTTAQFGATSITFNGTTGYMTAPASNLFNFGTGDFTIEAWVYASSLATRVIFSNSSGSGTNNITFYITSNGKLNANNFGVAAISSTGSITAGTWNYVAITKASGTYTFYINGSSSGSFGSLGTSNNLTDGYCTVGARPGPFDLWSGYIQDLRITKGYARTITASPTAAFPTQ